MRSKRPSCRAPSPRPDRARTAKPRAGCVPPHREAAPLASMPSPVAEAALEQHGQQQAAAAGAEIEHPQRRAPIREQRQRRFHDSLAVGPGSQLRASSGIGRLQNSRRPRICETGSRSPRRCDQRVEAFVPRAPTDDRAMPPAHDRLQPAAATAARASSHGVSIAPQRIIAAARPSVPNRGDRLALRPWVIALASSASRAAWSSAISASISSSRPRPRSPWRACRGSG